MAKSKKAISVAVGSKSKKQVREDLIAQLKAMGADVLVFKDLIDRYMFYRDLEIKMQRDIANRGLEFEARSATGTIYMKENPSVKNAVIYNCSASQSLTSSALTQRLSSRTRKMMSFDA